MPKFEENPNLNIPIEDEGEISQGTENRSDLSLEELAAEISRRNKAKEIETKPVRKANLVDALEIDPNDKPPVEKVEETVDPRFVGKSTEELQVMYLNVEALQKLQTDELGTLRKENKEFKDQQVQIENLNLQELERKIMPEVESWDEDKRKEWFKVFNEKPEQALKEVIDILTRPLAKKIASSDNKEEVLRLKTLHKDHVVPYVEKEINALIAANEGWWKKYGTSIFEHAYDVTRNRDFKKYATVINQTIKTKEDEQTAMNNEAKDQTFVEGQRPVKIIKKGKETTLEEIHAQEPDKAMAVIAKELIRRGIKVETE